MGALLDAIEDPLAAADGQHLRLKAGDTVHAQGDPSDTVYLLVEGDVALVTAAEGAEHPQTTLLLRAPAIFGDREAVLGTRCAETALTLSVARLRAWTTARFLDERAQDAGLRERVAQDLARRYERSLALQRFSQWPLRLRVPRLLADLPPGVPTELLARICNTTEKSVSRVLADLNKARAAGPSGMTFETGTGQERSLFHSLTSESSR